MLSLPRGINVIFYMPLFFMFVNCLMANRYLEEVSKRVLNHTNRMNVRGLVWLLTSSYLLLMPSILKSDLLIYGILSFIWAPQILTNLSFGFRDRRFIYRFKYLVVQSAVFLLLPFEARGGGFYFRSDYDQSVFHLRPHPYMVIKLIWCFVFQIVLLMI